MVVLVSSFPYQSCHQGQCAASVLHTPTQCKQPAKSSGQIFVLASSVLADTGLLLARVARMEICLHNISFGSCLGPVHAEWPQDPFVTLNGLIVRLGILSQTLVLGDPVCTKQVPGQYQEPGTAFIPGLTNSYRGSFAHLLQWRRLEYFSEAVSLFSITKSKCRCSVLAKSHVYQS